MYVVPWSEEKDLVIPLFSSNIVSVTEGHYIKIIALPGTTDALYTIG